MSKKQTPYIRDTASGAMHAMTPTVPSIKAYVSRKQRPMIIRSGLPNTVHDLSPVTQQSTTVGDQSVENDFATRSSSSHSDLSKLLSLLPRKPQRQQTCTGPNPEDSEEGEDCSEDHARLVRKRKPTLKRIDEASHLHRDERQEYEKKRDDRLAHYEQIDAFQLHTEDVLWI